MRAKIVLALAIALILCAVGHSSIYASRARVVDNANMLSAEERRELSGLLDSYAERHQFDIVVVTVMSLDGRSIRSVAENFYAEHGYGLGNESSGILLLIAYEEGSWRTTTSGLGIDLFTQSRQNSLMADVLPLLGDEEYMRGFVAFANGVDAILREAADSSGVIAAPVSASQANPDFSGMILVSVIIGAVIAGIVMFFLYRSMKSVRSEPLAHGYLRQGSFALTSSRDIFLFRSVSKIPISQNTGGRGGFGGGFGGGGFGGGGRGFGGSGGSFRR